MRAIFSTKANLALDDIISRYNLQETHEEFAKKIEAGGASNNVVIDRLAKSFALKTISEESLVASLQKETAVSQQQAEKISKEIITNIIPFLEIVAEEDLKDPDFVDKLSKKLYETKEVIKPITALPVNLINEAKKTPIEQPAFQKPIPPTIEKTVIPTTKKSKPISKTVEPVKPTIQQYQRSDSYREPIE